MSPFRSTEGCPGRAENAPDAACVSPERLGNGVATDEFRRQTDQVTQFFISGDHAQVDTGRVGGDQRQIHISGKAAPTA